MATRPRPRPVPKQSTSSASASKSTPNPDDEDSLFLRNQQRTAQTWAVLNTEEAKHHPPKDHSDCESDARSPQQRKGKKRAERKTNWQNSKDLTNYVVISDDEDEDVMNTAEDSDKSSNLGTPRKRKRQSRSLTPPPQLPAHRVQNARNIIRQALADKNRSLSPTNLEYEEEESANTIILDPELESIRQNIRSNSCLHSTSPDQDLTDVVTVKVKWQKHPLTEYGGDKMWAYRITRKNGSFRELFDNVGEESNTMAEHLILRYENKRIFPSVTPATLGMWGVVEIIACDDATWAYIQEHPPYREDRQPVEKGEPLEISDDEEEYPSYNEQVGAQSDDESDSAGEVIKLKVQSDKGKETTLSVRQTTKCGSIVKAYLKKVGLADKYIDFINGIAPAKMAAPKRGRKSNLPRPNEPSPQLCIDGERVSNDAPVSNYDLEDEDIVDVVGL